MSIIVLTCVHPCRGEVSIIVPTCVESFTYRNKLFRKFAIAAPFPKGYKKGLAKSPREKMPERSRRACRRRLRVRVGAAERL